MPLRDDLDALLLQSMSLSQHSLTSLSRTPDLPLEHYRHIGALCAQGLRTIETQAAQTGTAPDTLPGYDALMAVGAFCMQEHRRICREHDAAREHSRRWSEVHDEFNAAQREGRPMRANWSWERHHDWHGDLP